MEWREGGFLVLIIDQVRLELTVRHMKDRLVAEILGFFLVQNENRQRGKKVDKRIDNLKQQCSLVE